MTWGCGFALVIGGRVWADDRTETSAVSPDQQIVADASLVGAAITRAARCVHTGDRQGCLKAYRLLVGACQELADTFHRAAEDVGRQQARVALARADLAKLQRVGAANKSVLVELRVHLAALRGRLAGLLAHQRRQYAGGPAADRPTRLRRMASLVKRLERFDATQQHLKAGQQPVVAPTDYGALERDLNLVAQELSGRKELLLVDAKTVSALVGDVCRELKAVIGVQRMRTSRSGKEYEKLDAAQTAAAAVLSQVRLARNEGRQVVADSVSPSGADNLCDEVVLNRVDALLAEQDR